MSLLENWTCTICNTDDDDPAVQCDRCDIWYHTACVGVTVEEVKDKEWCCKKCVETNIQKKLEDEMCAGCGETTNEPCIQCEECTNKYHKACVGIDNEQTILN